MKFLKKYWIYIIMAISFGLAEIYLDDRTALKVEAALFLITAVFILTKDMYQRKKYAHCPQCGTPTETDWHTEQLDASDKPVRIGWTWHFGGSFVRKTAIIRCRRCGWQKNRYS